MRPGMREELEGFTSMYHERLGQLVTSWLHECLQEIEHVDMQNVALHCGDTTLLHSTLHRVCSPVLHGSRFSSHHSHGDYMSDDLMCCAAWYTRPDHVELQTSSCFCATTITCS